MSLPSLHSWAPKSETLILYSIALTSYQWWYLTLFALMVALSLVTVLAFPTNLSELNISSYFLVILESLADNELSAWWSFFLALAISFAFSLPVGIIQAITNTQIGLNVLTEFVYGYIQPGRPLALMIFKTYGYITMSQALSFVSDLKFGHYMKVSLTKLLI